MTPTDIQTASEIEYDEWDPIDELVEKLVYRTGFSAETIILTLGFIVVETMRDERVQRAAEVNPEFRFVESQLVKNAVRDAVFAVYQGESFGQKKVERFIAA